MTTDYSTPDEPIFDVASAVKEAIRQATSQAWKDDRSTYNVSGAEAYVAAVRALTALETPANTLLACLQGHKDDQEIVLDNEARELASRVLSGILGAVADLIEVDYDIAEIFYPGVSDAVGDGFFYDALIIAWIPKLLKKADVIESIAGAAGHPESSQLDELDPFGMFKKMKHARLDVTSLEKRFNIDGTMSSNMVAEFESLLLVLGQVRSQLVMIIKDNWKLRDVVGLSQPQTVEVTVGDVYANITNSVIAGRRARIEGTVNNVSPTIAPDVADALRVIGEQVAKADDTDAVSDFESLTRELAKPEPDKSRLRARWEALISIVPGIITLTDAVAKIKGLF